MILLDANLLIYAIDRDSPHHAKSRRWLEDTLSSDTPVGLPWLVALAFVRITTRVGIMRNPLSPEQAVGFVDEWLGQPYAVLIGPGENHWQVLRSLLLAAGTAGNLTSDAHLAALSIEHGCQIASADNDFLRFPGVTLVNPLAEQ